jgi:hypothetical protein
MLLAAGVLVNVPDNPVAANYPALYCDIANFCSACFQYMLIMTETVYRVPPENQKLFFNEGLHRSMIWVLDKYIRTIRQIPITRGAYAGMMMGPVFENVSLGLRVASFAGLTAYGAKAIAAATAIIALEHADVAADKVAEALDPKRYAAKAVEDREGWRSRGRDAERDLLCRRRDLEDRRRRPSDAPARRSALLGLERRMLDRSRLIIRHPGESRDLQGYERLAHARGPSSRWGDDKD